LIVFQLVSWSRLGKLHRKNSSSRRTNISTTITTQTTTISTTTQKTTTTTTVDYFMGEIVDAKPLVSTDKDTYSDEEEEENARLYNLQLNANDSNRLGVNWNRLAYDKDYSNGVASISSILLFIIPLLLVLLF
jgi:hypothetical protein